MAPDRTTVVLCAAAPLLLVAGLIPTIVYWDPTLDGILTRVSYFSTLGAALGAVALLALGTGSVIRGGRNADILVAFASAPLILLAAFTQLRTEATYAAVWVEQKDLWTQMVELIPALAPNSSVFFVMPGYEDRFGFTNYSRTPILDSLDASMALRVVYGDEQLAGDVLYPGVNVSTAPVLAPAGVMHWWHKDVTPYDQAVFVIYAGAPRRLQIVRDLSVVADVDFAPSTYQPLQRILPSPVGVPPLRSVIYAGPGPQSRD